MLNLTYNKINSNYNYADIISELSDWQKFKSLTIILGETGETSIQLHVCGPVSSKD